MNPDRQPLPLEVARVEWVPSSLDSIEVRVFGAWHGSTVPPTTTLLVGSWSVPSVGNGPDPSRPPAWSAAFVVASDARALLESGEAALDVGEGMLVALPAADPGRMESASSDEGVVVDPAVLAERRARRAEMAEESAALRAVSAEEAAETLRAQLGHLEERLIRAGAERDALASRVADSERQLRLAEQREEAERRRRAELEDEVADDLRVADASLTELRSRLAGAEEIAHALELELAHARRRQEEAERTAASERAAREALEAELSSADPLRVAELEAQLADYAAQLSQRLEAADSEELARLRAHTADLEARLASADPAELAALRARAADLEARLASADPAELAALRARVAELESSGSMADRPEVSALRARLAELEPEVETLRARAAIADVQATELDALRAHAAAAAEQDAELEALRARLSESESGGVSAELDRLRAHAAVLERRLAEPSERELVLAERVASLEAELERRISAQERVTSAITAIRDELNAVHAQVEAGRSNDATLRAEIAELEGRRRDLESAVADRDRQLDQARAAVDEARAAADEHRTRATELLGQLAESHAPPRRADLEARLHELAADLAAVRDSLTTKTAELEARLAEERARRVAAEAKLTGIPAPPRPPQPAKPAEPARAGDPFAAAEGDALDALVAGLRAEVAAARDQLDALDVPPPAPEPPAIEDATRERLQSIEAELRAAVPDPSKGVGARDVIASLQHAADRLRAAAQEELARAEELERGTTPPADAAPAPPPPAAPPASSPAGAGSVSPSPVSPPAGAGASPPPVSPPAGAGAATPPPASPPPASSSPAAAISAAAARLRAPALAPRPLAPLSDESPWLRRALERMAVSDRKAAAELFVALLPAQALAVDRIAYDVIVPELGPLRVRIGAGAGSVEPVEARGAAHEVDAVFEGDVSALAPLAAGGTGWWLRNVRIREGRRQVWRLARARRQAVSLADLARSPQPPDPTLVLPALAAAVDPASTAGHRFSVEYLVEGDGGWRIQAADGLPLAVGAPEGGATSEIRLTRGALYPLLAGLAIPPGERLSVSGDQAAAEMLHTWFDRARGLAPDRP